MGFKRIEKRQIQENGMSLKLVEFFNNATQDFQQKFLNLFTNIPDELRMPSEVEYIDFTGDDPTYFGRPDITIRFTDGSYFYIEVKTNKNTPFQETQMANVENEGYIGLIKLKGQKPAESFAFLIDKTHMYYPGVNFINSNLVSIKDKDGKEYDIPVLYWNDVCKILKPTDSLYKDIEKNVDGIISASKSISFSDEEIGLMNSEVLKPIDSSVSTGSDDKVNSLISKVNNSLSEKIKNLRLGGYEYVIEYDLYIGVCIDLIVDGIVLDKKIYIGYVPQLLEKDYCKMFENNQEKTEKTEDELEKFLYSVGFYYDILAKKKYEEKLYCIDKYRWVYFPMMDCNENKTKESFTISTILKEYLPDLNYIKFKK